MRILHITPSYKPAYVYGGPIYSVALLTEAQAKAGYEVSVVTTTANGGNELDVAQKCPIDVDGVSVTYFPRWSKDHTHFSPALLAHVWKHCAGYEVVHIHSWWNLVAVLSAFLCRRKKIKPVISPRGMLSDFSFKRNHASPKTFLHKLIGRPLLAQSVLHATSETEQDELSGLGFSASAVPNLIELSETDAENSNKTSEFQIGFLSRIHAKKNLEAVFEALPGFGFPYRFLVAGEGQSDYVSGLERVVESFGVTDRVDWLGPLSGSEKYQFLARLDLLVLVSFNENFANVVLEALSVGTPVLVSEQVGLADYVRRQDFGWVYQTGGEPLDKLLRVIYSDTEKRTRIRRQAPRQVRLDFSAENCLPEYLKLYAKVKSTC